jgi:hypothetical protein
MKKTDKEVLTAALDAAILALDDWAHITAPEYCDESRVTEARATEAGRHGVVYCFHYCKS